MTSKSRPMRLLYAARDLRAGPLFDVLDRYARGDVLDVGGWDFILTALRRGVRFRSWTILEPEAQRVFDVSAEGARWVLGDGCAMGLRSDSFDTVLNIQVLEHVFEPLRMVDEVARVARPGGHAIFLIPQTATVHQAPHFYGNLSRYWIVEAMKRAGLEILEHRPIGGFWSSLASRQLYFFLQSFRFPGMSDREIDRRSPGFYLLWPLMALFALVAIPICLFLSLGDLSEEPNNHLVVTRKPQAGGV